MSNPFKGATGKNYSTYESFKGVNCYGGVDNNDQGAKKNLSIAEDDSCAVDKFGPKKKVPGLS